MDPVTQVALGAAIGEATAGRQAGRRAMLWGGICAALPDFDTFVPLGDAVADFTYHRSVTHSLLVLTALTPLMTWLVLRIHRDLAPHRLRVGLAIWLAFLTHPLLDAFTVYGTQLLWPVDNTPVAWASIFIIDPFYTLPLLIGVIAALVLARTRRLGHALNAAGLTLSTLYLAWTLGAKAVVEDIARDSLAALGLERAPLVSTPAPFQSVLWRVVAMDEASYLEGYYSLAQERPGMAFTRYPSRPELLRGLEAHWPVQRLQWFTRGFYRVSDIDGQVVITDLRMGMEPGYVFRFVIGEAHNPHARPLPSRRLPPQRDFGRAEWLWRRIWSAEAE